MTLGLIGRKVGMTRIFSDDGDSIPVTVVDVSDNRVTQLKPKAVDGYAAIQLGFGLRRANRVAKSQKGHYAKASVEAPEFVKEFPISEADLPGYSLGAKVKPEIFSVGQLIDVSGISQGKGYAGVIKRHNFSSNRASHGNSRSHNVPGSIGMAQDPGRVFPGKRMSGHLGAVKRTVQNLKVIRVDVERGLLLVQGAVPGSKGGSLVLTPSKKGA